MKRCPECRRDYYDDSLLYCLEDGTALVQGAVPSPEERETVIIESPASRSTGADTEAETRVFTRDGSITREFSRHKGMTAAAILIGAIVLTGFGYGVFQFVTGGRPAESPQQQPRAANIRTQRLTGDGKTRGAEISPDGKFLAYIRADGAERSLWLKQIEANSNIEIVKPGGEIEDFYGLAFSPDGNFVYFNAEGSKNQVATVYRVPTLGGTPTKAFSNAFFIQFSPDGNQVSFTRIDAATNENAVFVANADGSNERKLASRFNEKYFDGAAPWSSDGKHLAVVTGDDSLAPGPVFSVSTISVDDGSVTPLGESRWENATDLIWHPEGEAIIFAGTENKSTQAQIFEVAYPSGSVRRVTNNLNGYYSVSITADGRSIVTSEIYSRSAVWVSPDLKPENAKQVMPDTGDTWGIDWTPDGRIVYISDQTGDPEVWIMDADGANAKPITNDKIAKAVPVVSPDGKYILYAGNPGQGEIIRINFDGSNRTVLADGAGADNPDVSHDGKWVIYSAWVNGMSSILRVPIEGGEPQVLTQGQAIEPRYSRDGTKIAYFRLDPGTLSWNQLEIISADGGAPIKVLEIPSNTNIGRGPVWTPGDKGIMLVVAPGERQELWLQPVDGSPGKQVTDVGLPGIARREYSPDGKRIAIVRAQGVGNAIMITDFR